MTAAGLWIRLGIGCALAAGLAVAASPPAPGGWTSSEPLAVGVGAGLALFLVLARVPSPVPLALAATLVLVAGAEEVTWRWFVLGELAGHIGPVAALIASAAAFGAVHPGARFLHTATGLAFGAVYLVTGSLLSAWVAHAAYNLAVVTAARRPAVGR